MSRFSITRARKFLKNIQRCPLLENIGGPNADSSIARATTFAQFSREYKSSSKAMNVAQNHDTARKIDKFGFQWFQEKCEDQFDAVYDEVERTGLEDKIDALWRSRDFPQKVDDLAAATRMIVAQLRGIAFDHALDMAADESFGLKYAEPWLRKGYLVFAWKGRVPPAPKVPAGVMPHTGLTVDQAMGDGVPVVF